MEDVVTIAVEANQLDRETVSHIWRNSLILQSRQARHQEVMMRFEELVCDAADLRSKARTGSRRNNA
jgi:hypothetical protein